MFNLKKCLSAGKVWKINELNFDNIGSSIYTLFVISSFDKWSTIFYIAINSDIEEKGPSSNNNKWTSYLFFFGFILIGVMFFLNLFMGVIFSNFLRAQRRTNNRNLNNNQYKYLQIVESILDIQPYLYVRPLHGFKRFCYDFINGKIFEIIVFLYTTFYLCLLAFYKDSLYHNYIEIVRVSSITMACLINIEFITKIICLGGKGFLSSKWNRLEIFVLITFNANMLLSYLINNHIDLKLGVVNKILWLTRMIVFCKIYQKFYFFRKLVRVLKFSFSLFVNLAFLFVLMILIYGLIGFSMYSSIEKGYVIGPYLNFQNIIGSMFLLFKIAVFDDWSYVIFDCVSFNSYCANNDLICSKSFILLNL